MDNQVEEIKNRLDVVDVVSEYVTLKPAGANFKGLCPFHNEKTPSFMVSPERQIWHCFGCGSGGDMFSFIMKIEGVEFPEALRILAKKAGVELRQVNPQVRSEKNKLFEILLEAARFFHKNLISPQGKQALDYLTNERKINQQTITEFKLGWAGDSWDDLLKHLQSKGYNASDIMKAGLILQKRQGNGYFNRFRERIMFPISDAHGSIVGFTGRILVDQENSPKYMNTPETSVFNKSYILYGLEKAKQVLRQEDCAVVVEGQMDVIASHQAGVTNVIASSGTALTAQQVKLIKRYTNNIVFAMDLDLAGQEATKRGIEIALSQEMNIKVAVDLAGKDPDEAIQDGVEIWTSAIKNAKPVMEYYFSSTFDKFDISQVEGKKQAAKVLVPVIAKFGNKVEQDYWIKELAQGLGVSEGAIRETLQKVGRVNKFPKAKEIAEQKTQPQAKSRQEKSSENFLALVLKFADKHHYLLSKYFDSLESEVFVGDNNLALAKELKIYYNDSTNNTNEESFDASVFIKNLTNDQLKEYAEFLLLLAEKDFNNTEEDDLAVEAKRLFRFLENEHHLRRAKNLTSQISQAEKSGDEDKLIKLIEEYNQLLKKRSSLN